MIRPGPISYAFQITYYAFEQLMLQNFPYYAQLRSIVPYYAP